MNTQTIELRGLLEEQLKASPVPLTFGQVLKIAREKWPSIGGGWLHDRLGDLIREGHLRHALDAKDRTLYSLPESQ